MFPLEKALKRERDKLHEMADHRQCFKTLPLLIEELNRHLKGWANYFSFGYPRVAFGEINSYVRSRPEQHLRRSSARRFPSHWATSISPAASSRFAKANKIRFGGRARSSRERRRIG